MWGEAPFLGKFIEENSYEEMTLRATGKGTGRLNAVITVNMGASPDTPGLVSYQKQGQIGLPGASAGS